MNEGYLGLISAELYAKALEVRGDDDTCWDERLPLEKPRLMFGEAFPEDARCDDIIEIWETALAEAKEEFRAGGFVLASVTLSLEESPNSNDGELTWEKNVLVINR